MEGFDQGVALYRLSFLEREEEAKSEEQRAADQRITLEHQLRSELNESQFEDDDQRKYLDLANEHDSKLTAKIRDLANQQWQTVIRSFPGRTQNTPCLYEVTNTTCAAAFWISPAR